MLEFLVQMFGEFIVQVIGQLLVELGLHAIVEPFMKPPSPLLAAIGYILIVIALGFISLIAFSDYFVHSKVLRVANLILTPLAVGASMAALGAWRIKRGDRIFRIDNLAYGYLFALSIAMVRFWLAR